MAAIKVKNARRREPTSHRIEATGAHPTVKPRTRIQREKQEQILEAALDVFSVYGFRGSTIDQIAEVAGMSKPNLLYYFPRKEDIHRRLIQDLLVNWLAPLRDIDAGGDPVPEIRSYIRRKIEMARDFPRESRLFANEMLQGAPHIIDMIELDLKALVDEKAKVLLAWMRCRQDRAHRPLPPDLFDLGHHTALCRLRCAGARRPRPRSRRRRPFRRRCALS
jgi:TetR/AcrR family transcriptional regulator